MHKEVHSSCYSLSLSLSLTTYVYVSTCRILLLFGALSTTDAYRVFPPYSQYFLAPKVHLQ